MLRLCVLGLLGLVAVPALAADLAPPTTVTLAISPKTATLVQSLEDWIVLLETGEMETAQKRWANDSATADAMKQWWAKLENCHKQYDYRKWLDGARQIGDATKFKVGGHSCGYMHVDWEKTAHGWRIARVWMCR